MNLLKALVKTVVEIPISVVKDVFIMGGVATENGKPYTKETYEEIIDELED